MLSLVRPDAPTDFAAEAKRLLDDLRPLVAKRQGKPHSDDFKGREVWSGSWKREGRPKRALAGVGALAAKCAWCERLRDISRELDVEHYRPKVAITRWEGDPPLVSDEPPKEIDVGPGYWWLAFAWENYSLSCKACNQAWKRNLFPVAADPRPACLEGVEASEQPLLLDPLSPFKARDHFEWMEDATMIGISPQGRATIITCGLNRSGLAALRLKALNDLRPVLGTLVSSLRRQDAAAIHRGIGELSLLGSRSEEFAGMVRWFAERALLEDWEDVEGLPL